MIQESRSLPCLSPGKLLGPCHVQAISERQHVAPKADPTQHVLLFTEPPLNPKAEREKMVELLFETFKVPAIYIAPKAVLSLYSRDRLNGIVLHSGDVVSYVVPCLLGTQLYDAITRIDVAGGDITDSLMASLTRRGYDVSDWERVREIKEKSGYVAVDYEVEMDMCSSASTQYTLPDGQSFAIGTEWFRNPKVLFIGREGSGIHEMTYNTIRKCCSKLLEIKACGEQFNNIILTGRSTLLPGFAERLDKEIAVFDKLENKCARTKQVQLHLIQSRVCYSYNLKIRHGGQGSCASLWWPGKVKFNTIQHNVIFT
ncbi:hypothetical protein OSB04_012117 [Centaurea solstitialis]|uniref:Actin n=1 Tax=Centaurea solstitialis TaxID=347529 RepID=A0AA38TAT7_9ASTR|nr:hypothetical protein OSB04_012117 [Centaurea solstitialis]